MMRREIGQQPAAVAATLTSVAEPARQLAAAMGRRRVDRVVLIARGSSDHAALYARYLLEGRCGLLTALAAPSLYTTYRAPVDLRRALAVGVSQSGQTPEITSALAYAAARGALTAAVTNDASSGLAASAEHLLVTGAGQEHSIAATKTFTTQLAVFALLAAALGAPRLEEHLHGLEHGMRETLAMTEVPCAEAAAGIRHADAAVCIARGFSYPVALEAALKLKEAAGLWAEGFSSADLRHGPAAAISTATPAVVFHAGGALTDDVASLEAELRQRGATVVSIGHGRRVATAAAALEELAPFMLVLPAQLLAERLAVLRARDPDHPPGLAKITNTR